MSNYGLHSAITNGGYKLRSVSHVEFWPLTTEPTKGNWILWGDCGHRLSILGDHNSKGILRHFSSKRYRCDRCPK